MRRNAKKPSSHAQKPPTRASGGRIAKPRHIPLRMRLRRDMGGWHLNGLPSVASGEGWFPPVGISMRARGRSQSIKHSGLRTDIINIVLAPPKSLNRWSCCQFLQSQFQTVRIQQKVVNAHGQYAVFIIQRSRSVGGDNDLFERIIDLQK